MNGYRTEFETVLEKLKAPENQGDIGVYETRLEFVRVAKGKIKIVSPETAVGKKRLKLPPPAPDPIDLRRLLQLRSQFETAPRRKRVAAAQKMGISPNRLTRLINLLDMVPEIEESISSPTS